MQGTIRLLVEDGFTEKINQYEYELCGDNMDLETIECATKTAVGMAKRARAMMVLVLDAEGKELKNETLSSTRKSERKAKIERILGGVA
jgi:hypothetical protein